jgi:hypothetical protein
MNPREQARIERGIWEYYEALHQAYLHVLEAKPDIIVVPLRGAEPLWRGIQLIASLERRSSELPRACFLRIGEIERGESKHPYSFRVDQQQAETVKRLSKSIKAVGKKEGLKVLLLDEASRGGSVTKNMGLVKHALKRVAGGWEAKAVAVVESEKMRHPPFERMAGRGEITPVFLRKIPTMDKKMFLLRLVRESAEKTRVKKGFTMHRLGLLAKIEKMHSKRPR